MATNVEKISKANQIAEHYGFKKINVPYTSCRTENSFLNPLQKKHILEVFKETVPREKDSVSRLYYDKVILNGKGSDASYKNLNFDILGIKDSIAEAIVIHTTIATLKEAGYRNLLLNINSLGDRKDFNLFLDNLYEFYKKNTNKLHPKCQTFYKKDVLKIFSCKHPECQELKEKAPRPICFLPEKNQRHLKKTLEYLEASNISYSIDDTLLSPENHFNKIVFEIKKPAHGKIKEDLILGRGGRYDEAAQNILRRRDALAVGAILEFQPIKKEIFKNKPNNQKEVYFIQFGPDAKKKSLTVIETLRKTNLKIRQDLHINKYQDQIEKAKSLGIPYVIILGQEEAARNTLILKDLKEATQKTLSLREALYYLKNMK